jgi:hypothetical protein
LGIDSECDRLQSRDHREDCQASQAGRLRRARQRIIRPSRDGRGHGVRVTGEAGLVPRLLTDIVVAAISEIGSHLRRTPCRV